MMLGRSTAMHWAALAITFALVVGAFPSGVRAASPEGNAYSVTVTMFPAGNPGGVTYSDRFVFNTDGTFSNRSGGGVWFFTPSELWVAFADEDPPAPLAVYLGVAFDPDADFIFGYGVTPSAGFVVLFGSKQNNNCAVDTDQDRLPDCVETNTGVYVSPDDTGTDPNHDDTDGDALNDGDEVLGTAGGLDLPGLGANPLRKTILMEYDWFDHSLDCGAHSHRPTQAILDRVETAFADAPVSNPDGSTGIDIIQDIGQGGLLSGGNLILDANGVLTGGVNSAEFASHKASHYAANREGYFHYTIFPHRYNTNSGSSGQAELPGDDMIVSLQCSNSTSNVSNTIVHELGHNLLLRHGGFENCNYKPNYNSVMNYQYQFPGVDTNCTPPGNGVLDYSIGDRITLNENSLDENLGTCGFGFPWDWNGNTIIESSVVFDVNFSGNSTCGGVLTVLSDHDDWANLLFQGIADADATLVTEIISCQNAPPL